MAATPEDARLETDSLLEEDNSEAPKSPEVKYDPEDIVKTEAGEDVDQDSPVIKQEVDCDLIKTEGRPRGRRRKKFDGEDDDSDETWSVYNYRKKQSKYTPRKSSRVNDKKTPEISGRPRRKRKSIVIETSEEDTDDSDIDGAEETECPEVSARRTRRSGVVLVEENVQSDEETRKCSKTRKSKKGKSKRILVRRAEGGRKKRISEMTEDERKVMKERWREESRQKRLRQRARWTEEERKEYLAKQNERKRQLRQAQREKMTPEEEEEYKRKARESMREKRQVLPHEKKREAYQRNVLRQLEKKATMTEEEKEEAKRKLNEKRQARLAQMTQEELEELKKKNAEYAKRRKSKLSEEDKCRRRAKAKQYRDNLSPERKSKFLARLREAHYKRMERVKQDPQKFEELKTKWKEDAKKKKEYEKELKKMTKIGEVIIAHDLENPRRRGRKKGPSLEDKKKIKADRRKAANARARTRRRLKMQQMLDSGMSIEEISREIETPEQRERRLTRNRISRAKKRLREQLEDSGAPSKEIEEKVAEVEKTYQPTYSMRPYKPRKDYWNKTEEIALVKPTKRKAKSQTAPATSTMPTPVVEYQSTFQIEYPPLAQEEVIIPACATIDYATAVSPTRVDRLATDTPVTYHTLNSYPHQEYHIQPPAQGQPYTVQLHTATSQGGSLNAPIITVIQQQPQSQSYSLQQIQIIQYPDQPQTISLTFDGYPPPQPEYTVPPTAYEVSIPSSPPSAPSHFEESEPIIEKVENPTKVEIEPKPEPPKLPKKKRPLPPSPEMSPRKPRTPAKLPDWYKTGVPRGPKKKLENSIVRDAKCDECGNLYNKHYMSEHKRQFHNPNFKDGICVICNLAFRKAKDWYFHYRHDHLGLPKKAKKGMGKAKMRIRTNEKEVSTPKIFDPKERPFMCVECGSAYKHLSQLELHEYHLHGDGSKPENYWKCHLCSGKFKRKLNFLNHLKRTHESYKNCLACERCDKILQNETEMNDHIQKEHKDSYFPCLYCKAVKLTDVALKFHYNRCSKITRENLLELRKKWNENGEIDSIDRLVVQCEFCPRKVALMGLTRHYLHMHKVNEEPRYHCNYNRCRSTFRRREYYACHIESVHGVTLEESLEICRKINVESRDIEVKNLEGEAPKTRKRKPKKRKETKADDKLESKLELINEEDLKVEHEEEVKLTESEEIFIPEVVPEVKRKRGRPKKEPNCLIQEGESAAEEQLTESDEFFIPEIVPEVKRKRGRPKKEPKCLIQEGESAAEGKHSVRREKRVKFASATDEDVVSLTESGRPSRRSALEARRMIQKVAEQKDDIEISDDYPPNSTDEPEVEITEPEVKTEPLTDAECDIEDDDDKVIIKYIYTDKI